MKTHQILLLSTLIFGICVADFMMPGNQYNFPGQQYPQANNLYGFNQNQVPYGAPGLPNFGISQYNGAQNINYPNIPNYGIQNPSTPYYPQYPASQPAPVYQPTPAPQPKPICNKRSGNLIVNGGFEQNSCGSEWCIGASVSGWTPSPEIEVGKGYIYNSAMGGSWVSELDPNHNTCIKQRVNLNAGTHTLNFDWAARVNVAFGSNSFVVQLNDQTIKTIYPSDYSLHHDSVNFNIGSNCDNWISFCGTGTSDSYGMVIDNV